MPHHISARPLSTEKRFPLECIFSKPARPVTRFNEICRGKLIKTTSLILLKTRGAGAKEQSRLVVSLGGLVSDKVYECQSS